MARFVFSGVVLMAEAKEEEEEEEEKEECTAFQERETLVFGTARVRV